MYKIDYNVDKTENCIQIDSGNWLSNSSNLLQEYRLSGKKVLTCITEALETHLIDEKYKGAVNKGDIVLLSRVVSEVSQYKSHELLDDKKYYDVPILQVLGIFRNKKVSLDTLILLFDKFLYKKEDIYEGTLQVSDKLTTVGRVLKAGSTTQNVKEGSLVFIKDNMSTRIVLDGEEYFVAEEPSVVCIFSDEHKSLEGAKFINNVILMTPYVPERLTEHLWTPDMNYEDADYTDIYKRDRFKINYLDDNLTGLQKNDIIWVNRNVTVYAFLKGTKYFLINGKDHIEFKEL